MNAKTSYPGGAVCNAVEHLLFHKDAAPRLLAKVCDDLAAKGVEIRGDERTAPTLPAGQSPRPKPTGTPNTWLHRRRQGRRFARRGDRAHQRARLATTPTPS